MADIDFVQGLEDDRSVNRIIASGVLSCCGRLGSIGAGAGLLSSVSLNHYYWWFCILSIAHSKFGSALSNYISSME
jgi:hypothetical protein